MARLILRRQLRPAPPKALTFKDLKVGELFRRVVTPGNTALICMKVSNRKAQHRVGTTGFEENTLVERVATPPGTTTFQHLRIGDIFRFAVGDNTEDEFMKLGATEAESEDSWVQLTGPEPVFFLRHSLD